MTGGAKEALRVRKVNANDKENEKAWFTKQIKTLALTFGIGKEKSIPSLQEQPNPRGVRYKVIRNRTTNVITEMKKAY